MAKISPSPPPHHPDHRILIIGRNISNAENGSGGEIPGPAIMNNWQPTSVSPPTPSSSSSSSSSILTQSSPPFYHHNLPLRPRKLRKASLSCRHYSLATSSESWKLEASSSVVTIEVAASESLATSSEKWKHWEAASASDSLVPWSDFPRGSASLYIGEDMEDMCQRKILIALCQTSWSSPSKFAIILQMANCEC